MTGPLISNSQVSTIPTKDKHTFLPLFHHHISIHIICLNAFQTIEKKRKSQAQESLPEKVGKTNVKKQTSVVITTMIIMKMERELLLMATFLCII